MADQPTLSPADQYLALSADVGYVVLGHRTQIELTGRDRAAVLHNLCTNDIVRLQAGEGCEAFVTSIQGKTLGHILVFCGAEILIIETVTGQSDVLIPHLEKYVIREDVEIHNRTRELAELLLIGPRAADTWQAAGGQTTPAELYAHVTDEIGGHRVSVRRVPMTAVPTLLISLAADQVDWLAGRLRAAGAEACDEVVFDQLRVEAGWPHFGRDITPQNLPQEIDRDAQAISFTKGCYLGQETVARIDALGHVNRKLAGLRFESSVVPPAGCELTAGGRQVGHVTSAVDSPALNEPLALAFVRREHAEPGTEVQSEIGPARVVRLPMKGDGQ